ncbi:MAG: hypothetical protein JRI68_08175 [Deltaproteobacteria bacterium]|nr:hypothetical protein [Deltaproteobacteria bacterium]
MAVHDGDDNLADLDLPDLGEPEEGEGLDDQDDLNLQLSEDDQDDPFDDEVASDVPIDVELATTERQPSALGDDATGLDDRPTSDGLDIDEGAASLLDGDDQPMTFEGDDELGIDPIPEEVDDGGQEGLDDHGEDVIDEAGFPPLDGDEDGPDGEIDIGYEIGPPPVDPAEDETGDPGTSDSK